MPQGQFAVRGNNIDIFSKQLKYLQKILTFFKIFYKG